MILVCDQDYQIEIKGNIIEKVGNTKFLGVYLDDKLSWKKQIEQVKNKKIRIIAGLKRYDSTNKSFIKYKCLKCCRHCEIKGMHTSIITPNSSANE